MKNMKKVPWHIIISAMILTMLVLATSKVFAHGEGRCFTSASRNTFLRNGSFMKVVDHLEEAELRRLQGGLYKHGHRNQYYDRNGNPTTPSTAFFDIDGLYDDDELYVDCPTASQPPSTTLQRTPVNGCDPEPAPVGFTCDDLDVRAAGDVCHEWDFCESSFVGVPVLPDSIETVGDLWNYFHDLTGREIDIKFKISGWLWQTYKGPDLGEIPITPHLGIGVDERTIGFIDSPIGIIGRKVQGETVILEKPAGAKNSTHFVGFPESPLNYETFGDLLVRGVSYVRRQILIDGRLNYQFIHTTNSEGADEMIQPGDAVVMLITREVTLDLSGSVMSAPSVRRKGTLATSWGAMKR